MKDFKEVMSEFDLERISAALPILSSTGKPVEIKRSLSDERLSQLVAKLKEEGYTGESILEHIKELPKEEKFGLAKYVLNESIVSKLIENNDEDAVLEELEKVFKRIV